MIVYYLLWCALCLRLSFRRRRFASASAYSRRELIYIQYTSTPESVRAAREREVLNAKQTHSHGRYFPSDCQISRWPRLWLCDDGVKIITFIHIECMAGHQWGAERGEKEPSDYLSYAPAPSPQTRTHSELQRWGACISLNFLWQVTSSLLRCLRRQFHSNSLSCSPKSHVH